MQYRNKKSHNKIPETRSNQLYIYNIILYNFTIENSYVALQQNLPTKNKNYHNKNIICLYHKNCTFTTKQKYTCTIVANQLTTNTKKS